MMGRLVQGGTGHRGPDFRHSVAGNTGLPNGVRPHLHAWFVAFALLTTPSWPYSVLLEKLQTASAAPLPPRRESRSCRPSGMADPSHYPCIRDPLVDASGPWPASTRRAARPQSDPVELTMGLLASLLACVLAPGIRPHPPKNTDPLAVSDTLSAHALHGRDQVVAQAWRPGMANVYIRRGSGSSPHSRSRILYDSTRKTEQVVEAFRRQAKNAGLALPIRNRLDLRRGEAEVRTTSRLSPST